MPGIPTTTDLTLPRLPPRPARALRVAAFALGVLVIEAALAHGVVGPQVSRYVYLFIGVFVLALLLRFPLVTAIAFVGFSDFIFYPTYFAYHVGPVDVRPHELCLAALLLLAVFRPKRDTWGGTAGKALAAFFAFLLVSAALAILSHHTTLTEAFNWGRDFYCLTFFWVVIRLFPGVEDRRTLLVGATVIAAGAGFVAVLVALGAGFGHSLEAAGGQTVRAEEGLGSLQRVRLPGLSADYALFWFVVVQTASRVGVKRLLWGLALVCMLAGIVVSLNRNMWIGLTIGLLLMAVLGGVAIRSRLIVAIAVVFVAAGLFFVFGNSGTSDRVVHPLIHRGETLLNPSKTTQENSLQDRAKETTKAWHTFTRHPLLGVGVGAPFGVVSQQEVTSGTLYFGTRPEPQLFLHNQYLYLLLISGIPGLIAFVIFLGNPIVMAWRRAPADPAIVACGIGIALIMISSFVAIYLSTSDMTVMLGLLTGVIFADAEGRAADGRPSGLMPEAGRGGPRASWAYRGGAGTAALGSPPAVAAPIKAE